MYIVFCHFSTQFPTTEMHLVRRFPTSQIPFAAQITLPSKFPIRIGDPDPHLTHGSFGPPESTLQTASRSVQLFLHGSTLWQTDRSTDKPRYSVCNNRPHLHSSEMRPNNKLCNIVAADGTNQWRNINKIYNDHLYQSANFLIAPRTSRCRRASLTFMHRNIFTKSVNRAVSLQQWNLLCTNWRSRWDFRVYIYCYYHRRQIFTFSPTHTLSLYPFPLLLRLLFPCTSPAAKRPFKSIQ